jgi:DNA-binding GntR family transcriptional regulator
MSNGNEMKTASEYLNICRAEYAQAAAELADAVAANTWQPGQKPLKNSAKIAARIRVCRGVASRAYTRLVAADEAARG